MSDDKAGKGSPQGISGPVGFAAKLSELREEKPITTVAEAAGLAKQLGFGGPMKDKPCKLHLTLLDVNAQCPECKWPAGDHSTHPSNRPKKAHNEVVELRRELAALKEEHALLVNCVAYTLHVDGIVLRLPRQHVDEIQGTLALGNLEGTGDYVLRYDPPKVAREWHDINHHDGCPACIGEEMNAEMKRASEVCSHGFEVSEHWACSQCTLDAAQPST